MLHVYVELWRFEINNIIRVVKYEHDDKYLLDEWLIRRKARVHVPGQTSKRNTKSISSAISSQHISGKNSEREIKLP